MNIAPASATQPAAPSAPPLSATGPARPGGDPELAVVAVLGYN